MVVLYNIANEKLEMINQILDVLSIPFLSISKEKLCESVGFIIGFDGFKSCGKIFNDEGYESEFMLMEGLEEKKLDILLGAMRSYGIQINFKAVVTETNKNWPFYKLIKDVSFEHKFMKAIASLNGKIKNVSLLKKEDYSETKWNNIIVAVEKAVTVMSENSSFELIKLSEKEIDDAVEMSAKNKGFE